MSVTHHTRDSNGNYRSATHYMPPMDFVVKHIPDGVPFEIYRDAIGEDNRVTEDFEALKKPGNYHIVESPGGGGSGLMKVLDPLGLTNRILKLLMPSQKTSSPNLDNSQAASPNNSLTDRNNKPRPYERTYDICGTVQSIPADLMTVYRTYNNTGTVIEYGYYDVGRDYLDTPASGITDGDTLMADITGSSAAVYAPFTSPNSGDAPQTLVGAAITEGLYITTASNEIDGQTLRASNDLQSYVGTIATASYSAGMGTIVDPTGDSSFSDFIKVGSQARVLNVSVADAPSAGGTAILDGVYTVIAVSGVDIKLDVSTNTAEWGKLGSTTWPIVPGDFALVGPYDSVEASFSDWVSITSLKPERILVNISADNGMYKDDGSSSKRSASVTSEVQYQQLDDTKTPYGPVYSVTGRITGRSGNATGVSIVGNLPSSSWVRVRVRRVTPIDRDFSGQVVDEVKYANLYGQIRDRTTHYGNRTTVHTARTQTARATVIKQPQLKMLVTEKVFKYLGNGVFDTVRTNNTQAVQSLIRLMRDPVVGNLPLSTTTMDALLATQAEVEEYFQDARAGQFCYTFDKYTDTAQDIITTIAEAIFCSATRRGHDIKLNLERPRPGPEMVFTHRSKAPSGEKWTRQFNDKSAYDSLKFSYIDPDTNIKETIQIPETGGVKTDTFDSKGIRNYQQAYWHAWRRYQRNSLNRVSVEFTALEEGILVVPARPISVVKGSRVSPYDGYVVAVDGLTLVLSQNVEFTPGEDHSLILKKRDGGIQSVQVTPGHNDRTVIMLSAPQEAIYTGNSALKTEFSFGSDSRHAAQMIMVSTVEPSDDRTVRITGFNYDNDYYKYDGVPPFGRAFSNGFDNGFN